MPDYIEALRHARRWLDIIQSPIVPPEEARRLSAETVEHFEKHLNAGLIEYRKSVTEAGDFAAADWTGEGALLRDIHGREWIDCLGGYGLLSHGWRHPKVIAAVRAQLDRAPMPSAELLDAVRAAAARLMALVLPGELDHTFFCASGAEAVEGALKLARVATGKTGFIAASGAYHGKTLGAIGVIGKADHRLPVGPTLPNVHFAPFGDAAAVERQLDIAEKIGLDIAAVILEPVQGEAGAVVPPDDFWPRVRAACDRHGVLLIADEVQTGLGRTGKMWGVDHWNVAPDILTSAKALGGGVMPAGAFCAGGRLWRALEEPNPFLHSTTTGGNPLACAAVVAAIAVMLEEDLPAQAAEKGAYFKAEVEKLAARYSGVYERVTGLGLLIGQHFVSDEVGYRVAAGLFRRGVLVAGTEFFSRVIRLEPPLVISRAQIDAALDRLEDTLKEIRE